MDSNRHGAGVGFDLGGGLMIYGYNTILYRTTYCEHNLNAFQRPEKRFKGCFFWNQ